MVIKFPCKMLIVSLLTHSWTGEGLALIKSKNFLGIFHENRASLNKF